MIELPWRVRPDLRLPALSLLPGLSAAPFDQRADHGPGRHAIDVADHAAELDAAVVEHLVQPVDLGAVHVGELAPVARDQAQFAQALGRDQAGANQAEARQHGQPFGVGHVGLAHQGEGPLPL